MSDGTDKLILKKEEVKDSKNMNDSTKTEKLFEIHSQCLAKIFMRFYRVESKIRNLAGEKHLTTSTSASM